MSSGLLAPDSANRVDGVLLLELSVEQQCGRLGEILGLDGPVDEEVLVAAIRNPSYATNLLICRDAPQFLAQLLGSPPVARSDDPSAGELMKRGVEALWRWSRTGFTTVDSDVLKRRLAACETCPHLYAPEGAKRILYALTGTAAGRKSVCRKCGCPVTRKAGMAGESCPDAHPDDPRLTRWGEPRPDEADTPASLPVSNERN